MDKTEIKEGIICVLLEDLEINKAVNIPFLVVTEDEILPLIKIARRNGLAICFEFKKG